MTEFILEVVPFLPQGLDQVFHQQVGEMQAELEKGKERALVCTSEACSLQTKPSPHDTHADRGAHRYAGLWGSFQLTTHFQSSCPRKAENVVNSPLLKKV